MQKKKLALLGMAGCAVIAGMTACNNHQTGKENNTTDTTTKANVATVTKHSDVANDPGFVKDGTDLDCKWVTHGTGTQTAAIGDIAQVNVVVKIEDSVLINSYDQNNHQPVPQQIMAPAMKGDLMSGIIKMKAGDSAVFRMLTDTLYARSKQPKPIWAKSGKYMVWEVKVEKIVTKEQMAAEEANKNKAQNDIDDKLLQAYFKSHNIKNAKKTASGLYYTIEKQGSGPHPKSGQQVTVNYTGQNLKGEKFDSNMDPAFNHVSPFSFPLGQHQVISGWEEAVALMNKGMKGTFYLPSSIAYGAQGGGGKIAPNEVLMFNIELTSFK